MPETWHERHRCIPHQRACLRTIALLWRTGRGTSAQYSPNVHFVRFAPFAL